MEIILLEEMINGNPHEVSLMNIDCQFLRFLSVIFHELISNLSLLLCSDKTLILNQTNKKYNTVTN